MPSGGALTFGPFRLDPGTESLWREGVEMRLRPKTFAVLRHLAERPGRLVTKDDLLAALWPEVEVGEAALTVCVNEIRRALGDEARAPRFVETVHRRGYRFIGVVQAGERGAAGGPPPRELVGRQQELAALRGWLEQAGRGERRIGFVTGEAGIGKTTLIEAFLSSIAPDEGRIARGQCLEHYGSGEAYLPVLEALGRLARGSDGEQVVAVLARHAPTWLVQMPGLVTAEDVAALQPRIAGATRGRMLREMAEALEALAAEQPLVLVLEDLHWSDHSTLDLIAGVARRHEPTRLLLIGTYRPLDAIVRGHPLREVTHELALHGACAVLSPGLLAEDDVGHYLAARLGGDAAARLTGPVHRRTDGLPLFVVNVVEALTGQGLLVETGGRWEVTAGEAEMESAVPESLRQMIEQQLARLAPEEQRLLEAASVAGPACSAAAVAAALGDDLQAVEERCEALARRRQFLVSCSAQEWPDGTVSACYEFVHALYQQVLYERVPPTRLAGLHLRIAEREERGYRARLAERAALLAVHFERGRAAERAVHYRREAAEHALQRCAYVEAVEHLTRARERLPAIADEPRRAALELGVHMTLGPALIALRGSGAPDVEAVYLRARELAEKLGDTARVYPALWGSWFVDYSRGRYVSARAMGEQLLALAEREGDTGRVLEAHHALWATLTATGDAAAALLHIEQGHRLYDRERHHTQAILYGSHDAGVCSWYHLATARWLLGYPDAALAAIGEARARSDKLDHPGTTIIRLCATGWVHYYRGDLDDAQQCAERAVALATAQGFASYVDDGRVILACAAAARGREAEPIEIHYQRLRSAGPGRAAWRDVLCLGALARVAGERGDVELGLAMLDAVPTDVRATFFAPELERIRGELLLRRGETREAEGWFRRAIERAQARGERSLELRAAMSLARVLAGTGRRKDARQALDGVYRWFTEGLDTADLRAARALLDELKRGR